MNHPKASDEPHKREYFDTQKSILDYRSPPDHSAVLQYLEYFAQRYPFIQIQSLGNSILGRSVPVVTLGKGEKAIVFLGAVHATEWITSIFLLRFINEYAEGLKNGRRIYSAYLPYLYQQRRIIVIPMLNPDGVEYCLHGIQSDNPLYERVSAMNGKSSDFSQWNANARGVDLSRNYSFHFEDARRYAAEQGVITGAPAQYCGEDSESEPETGYLCNYLRFFRENIGMLLELRIGAGKIHAASSIDNAPARAVSIGKSLSRLCTYPLHTPDDKDTYGSLQGWCFGGLGAPAFPIFCGKDTTPIPLQLYFCIYASIRQLLFESPLLI